MKPSSFDYVRPGSVDEALAVLAERGDEAKVLAGGQSLLPLLNMRFAFPGTLVDVNRLAGLDRITEEDGEVRVGALVRQSAFEHSALVRERLPLAAECVGHVGHFVTRNRGTVGGSVAHADPRAELPVALLALGGSATAASVRGRRVIPAAELFSTLYTTTLAPDELLVETVWPGATPGWGYAFEEFALRHGDYALVMVACALRRSAGVVVEARLVAGSVADRPLELTAAATRLVGGEVDEEAAAAAGDAAAAAVDVSDDLYASAAYRRHLVALLTARAVGRAWDDAGGRQ